MDVFGAVMGGLTFTQGFFNYRNASRFAKMKNELNDRKRDFNLKQVRKAHEKNYGHMVGQFALMLGQLKDQKMEAQSSIKMNAQMLGMNGIDVGQSSYLDVADTTLENELRSSFNTMLDEQIDRGNEMYSQLIHQEFNVEAGYNQEKMQIRSQKIQEQAQAGKQMIQGMIQMATSVGAFGMGDKAGDMASKALNSMQGYQAGNTFYNNQGFGGNQYFSPTTAYNFSNYGLSRRYNQNNGYGLNKYKKV